LGDRNSFLAAGVVSLLHSEAMNRAIIPALAIVLTAGSAHAQWRNLPKDAVPPGPDGKPRFAAAGKKRGNDLGLNEALGVFAAEYFVHP